jgi:hypothetical protein
MLPLHDAKLRNFTQVYWHANSHHTLRNLLPIEKKLSIGDVFSIHYIMLHAKPMREGISSRQASPQKKALGRHQRKGIPTATICRLLRKSTDTQILSFESATAHFDLLLMWASPAYVHLSHSDARRTAKINDKQYLIFPQINVTACRDASGVSPISRHSEPR